MGLLAGCAPNLAYLQVKDRNAVAITAYTPAGVATILQPGSDDTNVGYDYACAPYSRGNSPIRKGTVARLAHAITVNGQPLMRADGKLQSNDRYDDVRARAGALVGGPIRIVDGVLYLPIDVSIWWKCLRVTVVTPVTNVVELEITR